MAEPNPTEASPSAHPAKHPWQCCGSAYCSKMSAKARQIEHERMEVMYQMRNDQRDFINVQKAHLDRFDDITAVLSKIDREHSTKHSEESMQRWHEAFVDYLRSADNGSPVWNQEIYPLRPMNQPRVPAFPPYTGPDGSGLQSSVESSDQSHVMKLILKKMEVVKVGVETAEAALRDLRIEMKGLRNDLDSIRATNDASNKHLGEEK